MDSSLIGKSIDRYNIIEQLGEGGMATVYKAYDTRLQRDVAVKVIRVDQFAPAALERVLKRFEREARSLARLSHPNIVSVIDFGEHEGIPYLVMEYLPGGTLKRWLGKPVLWQEAARLVKPIAVALAYAHQRGVVHRDVKPANILIGESGEPKLSDFGIAKILESGEEQTLTGTGVGVGTPDYMAPEQWTGEAGPAADIYSLGVVFYELIAGRKPYMADTPAAILLKQATEPLPRPAQFVTGMPENVERIVFRALARRPEDRYRTMGDFAAALGRLGSEEAEKDELPLGDELSVGPPLGLQSSADVEKRQKKKKGAGSWLLWVAGAAALVVLSGAAYGVLRPSSLEVAPPLTGTPELTVELTPIWTSTGQATFTPLPTLTQINTSTPTVDPDTPTPEPPKGIAGVWRGNCEGEVMFSIDQLNEGYLVSACNIDTGEGSTYPISFQSWKNEKLSWTCPHLVPYNGPPWYTDTNRMHYYSFRVQLQDGDDMQLSLVITVDYPSEATKYSGICTAQRSTP